MKVHGIAKKVILAIAFLLLLAITIQLIQMFFVHPSNSVKLVFYYLLCILSAGVFVFVNAKYQLKTRYTLAGLILLSFGYQLLFSLNVHMTSMDGGDLQGYFQIAINFVQYGFAEPFPYQALFPTTATYPAFLMPFMKLFGVNRLVPVIINYIFMTGFSCLVFYLCKRKMSAAWSLAAGFLVCLHPVIMIYANTCNAELIYATLVFAAFIAVLKIGDASKLSIKLLFTGISAILCGLSNLFRPLGIIMLLALLLGLLFFAKEKIRMQGLLCAVLLCIYMLTGFSSNAIQKHITKYPATANGFGWNLYVGASSEGEWNVLDAQEFDEVFDTRRTPSEIQTYFAQKGLQRYREMSWNVIPHTFGKLRLWYVGDYVASQAVLQDENASFYTADEKNTYLALVNIIDIPVLILSLLTGIWLLLSAFFGQKHEAIPLVFYLLGYLLVLMVLEVAPRYTISMRPIFCLFAVYGLHSLWKRFAAGKAGISV